MLYEVITVKSFIMDQKIVVGVGNIYASEALFRAGIHPSREAGRISLARYQRLAASIVITSYSIHYTKLYEYDPRYLKEEGFIYYGIGRS